MSLQPGPWLFYDNLATAAPLAAGAVNNTNSTDGNAVRDVTADTNLDMSISGALLVEGSAHANDDPDLKYKVIASSAYNSANSINITRTAGLVGYAKLKFDTSFGNTPYVGWHAGSFTTSSIIQLSYNNNPLHGDPGYVGIGDNSNPITSQVYALSGRYVELAIVLRATGAAYYLNDGNRYTLIGISDPAADTGTPLWFGVRASSGGIYASHIAALGVLKNLWTRYCLASDSFVRANGAPGNTDGIGTQEALDPTMAALAWTDTSGTSAIASNAFSFSSLTSSLGMSVINPGQTNVFIRTQITYSTGHAGIVFKMTDANNYLCLYFSSTSVITYSRVVAGVETVIGTYSATYSAGAYLTLSCSDNAIICAAYNNKSIFLFSAFSGSSLFPLGGTLCGVLTTSTANTFGSFAVFRAFETPPGIPQDNLLKLVCFGDSETEQLTRHTGYLRQLLGDSWVTVNAGVGGGTTANAVAQGRFARDVLRWKPRFVVIQMGTNDIANTGQVATVETNLQAWYTAASQANICVIAVTLYPRQGSASYTTQLQTDMNTINLWIKTQATNIDYIVDMYALLGDVNSTNTNGNVGPNAILQAYDDGSHLHLTQAGYTLVAQTIVGAVVSFLSPKARPRTARV